MVRWVVFLFSCIAVQQAAAQPARPSFDCARAQAWDERNICAFADLAELDRRIAAAWQGLTAQAAQDQRALLLAEQRAWLAERRACQGPVAREALSCLRRVMRARARDLEALAQAAPGAGTSQSSTARPPTSKPPPAVAATTALRPADCANPTGWVAQRVCGVPGMRELDAAVLRDLAAARARAAASPAAAAQVEAFVARYTAARSACAQVMGRLPVDCLQETMEDARAELRRPPPAR